MVRSARSIAVASCLWVAGALVAPTAQAQNNTGKDASLLSYVSCNGRVGFRTSEAQQGNVTLNSDTDALDTVFQVLDLGSGTVTNVTADATGVLGCGGDLFAFGLSEANQGTDFNGDLDLGDTVLFVYDASTPILINVGRPVSALAVSPTHVAFAVPEAQQGALGTDLNGDGDVTDAVLFVYDRVAATLTNVGRPVTGDIFIFGSVVAFRVPESGMGAAGTDLNGDGDVGDSVLHIYNESTSTLTNTGRQAMADMTLSGDILAFRVREVNQGADLNGDGDRGDSVLHLYCLGTTYCPATGLVNLGIGVKEAGYDVDGNLVAAAVSERWQNKTDLNGDGDTGDEVLEIYRPTTGSLVNTAKATGKPVKVAGNNVVFAIPERNQNKTDLNGDGDFSDRVVHIYNAGTTSLTNTQRAISRGCRNTAVGTRNLCFNAKGDLALFLTRERDQNRTDLNGDGDIGDSVAETWQISSGIRTASGLATGRFSGLVVNPSGIAAFRPSEKGQKIDLNGDGDRGDNVIAAFNSSSGSFTLIPRHAEPLFLVEGSTVVFRVNEGSQTANLNGDFDFNDDVLQYQVFFIGPTPTPTVTRTPTDTATPTLTPTITNTRTPTLTRTPTSTPTITNTPPPSSTPSLSPTPTVTPTITETPTITLTPTITETPTITPTFNCPPFNPINIRATLGAGSNAQLSSATAVLSPFALTGQLDMHFSALNGACESQVLIPKESVILDPVLVPGLNQVACVSLSVDGTGVLDCDGGRPDINVQISADHETTPGLVSQNSRGVCPTCGSPDDATCTNVDPVSGDKACVECVASPPPTQERCTSELCPGHNTACQSPVAMVKSGTFGPGDMFIQSAQSIVVHDPAGSQGANPGFCNDPVCTGVNIPAGCEPASVNAPPAATVFTSGTVSIEVTDANRSASGRIATGSQTPCPNNIACPFPPGQPSGQRDACLSPDEFSGTGAQLSCSQAVDKSDCLCLRRCGSLACPATRTGTTTTCATLQSGSLNGMTIVGGFPSLDLAPLNDVAITFGFTVGSSQVLP